MRTPLFFTLCILTRLDNDFWLVIIINVDKTMKYIKVSIGKV